MNAACALLGNPELAAPLAVDVAAFDPAAPNPPPAAIPPSPLGPL
jgi:hypothetical protein